MNYAFDDPNGGTDLLACFEADYSHARFYNISKIKSHKPVEVQVHSSINYYKELSNLRIFFCHLGSWTRLQDHSPTNLCFCLG